MSTRSFVESQLVEGRGDILPDSEDELRNSGFRRGSGSNFYKTIRDASIELRVVVKADRMSKADFPAAEVKLLINGKPAEDFLQDFARDIRRPWNLNDPRQLRELLRLASKY